MENREGLIYNTEKKTQKKENTCLRTTLRESCPFRTRNPFEASQTRPPGPFQDYRNNSRPNRLIEIQVIKSYPRIRLKIRQFPSKS